VSLQLRSRHRNEFGFGLDGLAHDGGFPAGAIDRCRLPTPRASVEREQCDNIRRPRPRESGEAP
jgi:hypothetical protein